MELRIETNAQILWLGDDGILRADYKPRAELELADAQEIIRRLTAVSGGIRRPILVDLTGLKSISRDARNHFAGPETAAVQCAVALLVRSPMAKAIGNFFLGLNMSLVPTRLVTSKLPALEWLRQYVP
ncbi:MAG: hypothetical protein JWO86_9214 [Myxococcaceae bacterium]|jgi:hypothetical protein|nr:hypothetical protein [Myxococcaceae bacterium]MEA2747784.1 hypothetical protein [Myxococcales bacterium]